MRKIHVLTQKESVEPSKLQNCSAVVIDVFLATSTIVTLLQQNVEQVYAVENAEKAMEKANSLSGSVLLLGELNGKEIEGFGYPDPSSIQFVTNPTSAIICSTNGTIAIQKASQAKQLFISSILNGHTIANFLSQQSDESSIVLICSGNNGRLSMEDLVGAGQIIHHCMKQQPFSLSDAAKLALHAFDYSQMINFENLRQCETAKLLEKVDFGPSINFVLDHFEKSTVVPFFDGERIRHFYDVNVDVIRKG